MAQFPDGPVKWSWCVQLVHGVHSSHCSHWCPAVFPGTRFNSAPQGGQKWDRISNANCQITHKSQGMTLDRQPSAATATTLKPQFLQANKPLTPLFLLLSSTVLQITQIQGIQGKSNLVHQEQLNPPLHDAGECSALARKDPQSVPPFSKQQSRAQQCPVEMRACGVTEMQVEKEKVRKRRRCGERRCEQCGKAQRGEEEGL
ncbi:hypothetical protein AMECASPLE_011918 [Ameca splendens]|uniref:Uncharacterized protein n=1 Tax=Ameca splendens TaxID=208324 RepID=A0ABV0ZLF7_9TELE